MRRTEQLEGLRMLKLRDVLSGWEAGGGHRRPWPAVEPLHGSRQPQLLHARGRRQDGQGRGDPSRTRAGPARHRAHPAYSPQARGRSERVFRTLQDRLPKELKLAGISTMAAANRVLKENYLSRHNARFAIAPAEAGSAFVPVERREWRDVLAIQEERTVVAAA